jgi:hypothetical protein
MPSLGLEHLLFPAIIVYWVAIAAVHVAFGVAVYRHGSRLRASGPGTLLVVPELWALATFAGGPIVGAAYWLVNASTLRVAPDQ